MKFYLEYNLELSEESKFDYYVVHYDEEKFYKDSHLYNEKGGYVMLKLVGREYKLLSTPKENEKELKEFVENMNKKFKK